MSYPNNTAQSANDTYYLPFIVVGLNQASNNWDYMTLSLNATHANQQTQYNLHNLNGHMSGKTYWSAIE